MEFNLDTDLRGGVKSILLMAAEAAFDAVFSSEGVTLSLPSEGTVEVVPDDDSAQWTEQLEVRDNVTRVEHDLEFCVEWRHPAGKLLHDARQGVVAVVELTSGRKLLAGYSATFAAEQPLRLKLLKRSSGRTREEDAKWSVHLKSIDDAVAHNCIITN